ncbi:MAG: sigma-54-dependent Fis family transcriptional regulator [Deltaproteobacteria bacterium]|nr:sigma-54-dependent Fis family transcriptional regulator [Deltaproteobacteria bacterium]
MSAARRRTLVIEDERASRDALAALLGAQGHEVTEASSVAAVERLLAGEPPMFDLAFVDLGLPDGDGMDLIRPLSDLPGGCAVVVLTGERRLERAVDAMRRGAVDYLEKPLQPAVLELTLGRVGRALDDRDEQRRLRRELIRHGSFQGMVGRSRRMLQVFEQVERAAPSDLPIFIIGESGTGKELLARSVHEVSRRRGAPFVALNCGAIPSHLAESELFGHEKGAFTGAIKAQMGAFERAHHGTLFLDEVTEMPLDLQVVLLRVLEVGHVQRVGGAREVPVDVRVVAATNRDPREAVKAGRLREDLFYRLHVIPLALPPLRERRDDVQILATHFLADLAERSGAGAPRLTEAALDALVAHAWPGNIRELRNTLSRAFVLRAGDAIDASDLGLAPGGGRAAGGGSGAGGAGADGVVIPSDATLAEAERRLILSQLERQRWHRGETAKVLGIAPKTLYNKCKAYGIEEPT